MEIDNLEIKIKSNSTAAANALNRLVESLTKIDTALSGINGSSLNNLANGVNTLSQAMVNLNNSGVKTADFTRLSRNIAKFGTINTGNLDRTASGLRQITNAFAKLNEVSTQAVAVKAMSDAVGKFGSVSVSRALQNMPLITKELRDMLTSLSGVPKIQRSVVAMTQALANLAAQSRGIGTSTNTVNKGLRRFSLFAGTASQKTFSLAAAFGKFYANYFLVVRGIKSMWKSVESSMNYVETFNYWNVTMDKMGTEFAAKQGENGEASAEAYVNGFKKKLNELTTKMTGYEIGAMGQLTQSGSTNLGLDPNQLMNFQARVGAITNSVGLLGDASLNTQKALSMLSADLSSLANIDLETVMGNLTSALVGQSRAVYKYGVDITSAALQEKAATLNITKKVAAMSQAEKMQLRLLLLLENTKVAWGDQANTINSVANQYRIFQQQVKNLGRVLGSIFIPIMQKALPFINGLIIALTNLLQVIGIQIHGENWLENIMDGISGGVGATEDLNDELEGTEDALNGAGNAAQKLKKQLQGFDELNNLTTSETSGAGGASGMIDLSNEIQAAVDEYERVWEEALQRARNKAAEYAEKIKKALQPIKDWISDFLYDLKAGRWFAVGDDISNAIVAGFDFGSKLLDNVDWEDIGRKIGKFLKGIEWKKIFKSGTNFFSKLFNAALDVWAGSFKEAPLETALVTVFAACSFIAPGKALLGGLFGGVLAAIGGFNLGKKIGELITGDSIYTDFTWEDFFKTVFTGYDTFGEFVTTQLNAILQTIEIFDFATKLYNAIGYGLTGDSNYIDFHWFGEGGFFSEVFGGYEGPADWLQIQVLAIGTAYNDIKSKIADICISIGDAIKELFETFGLYGFSAIYDKYIKPMLEADDLSVWFKDFIKDFNYNIVYIRNALISGLNNMIYVIESFINNCLEGYSPLLKVMSLVGEIAGISIPTSIKLPIIKHFFDGGFISSASIFTAGENGVPELMGTIGGKSAVASGEEITGIADAVYTTGETQASLLNTAISLLQVIADKEFGITDGQIAQSVVRSNRESQNRTGRPLLI